MLQAALFIKTATAGAVGHALGLLGVVQTEERDVDDFVFMHQRGAGQGFAFEPVVGAVADRRELASIRGGDLIKELPGTAGRLGAAPGGLNLPDAGSTVRKVG